MSTLKLSPLTTLKLPPPSSSSILRIPLLSSIVLSPCAAAELAGKVPETDAPLLPLS